MGKVYLNNFPRENAVVGQKFEGDEALEKELTDRGIIGEGIAIYETVKLNSDEANIFTEAIEKLELRILELEEEKESLVKFLEEAIDLPKGKVPEGYTKAE